MTARKSPQRRKSSPRLTAAVTTTTTTAVSPPQPPTPTPPKPWWELHSGKIVLAAATAAALTTLWNFSAPFRESHLPAASQEDVKSVDQKATETAAKILQQVEQLDTRQMQSIQRGQSVANQLRTLRMSDLRNEIARLKDAKDDASRTLMTRDQQELEALIQEQNSAPMP